MGAALVRFVCSVLNLQPRPRCLPLKKKNSGASHLLEYLAFKATQHRTHFRLVREVRSRFDVVEKRKRARESLMQRKDFFPLKTPPPPHTKNSFQKKK